MSNNELTKVLIVVGRDKTEELFRKRVKQYLYDSFEIRGVYALGEPTNVNDTERFVCFIVGTEIGAWTAEAQEIRLERKSDKAAGDPLSCFIFDTMDEALEFTKNELDFNEVVESILAFRDRAKDSFDKFGYNTALEIEKFQILMALANTGILAVTRGLLGGEQVPVVVLRSVGSDGFLLKPIAILMNNSVLDSLELPASDILEESEDD